MLVYFIWQILAIFYLVVHIGLFHVVVSPMWNSNPAPLVQHQIVSTRCQTLYLLYATIQDMSKKDAQWASCDEHLYTYLKYTRNRLTEALAMYNPHGATSEI